MKELYRIGDYTTLDNTNRIQIYHAICGNEKERNNFVNDFLKSIELMIDNVLYELQPYFDLKKIKSYLPDYRGFADELRQSNNSGVLYNSIMFIPNTSGKEEIKFPKHNLFDDSKVIIMIFTLLEVILMDTDTTRFKNVVRRDMVTLKDARRILFNYLKYYNII